MKKTNHNLILISSIFIMSLLVANVVAGKVIQIGWFVVPSAVVAYGITFLCTDVVGEIWGKKQSNELVKIGFIVQLMSLALILLAIALPTAPFALDYGEKFKVVLSQSSRVVFASLVAYLVSQFNDVMIFHKLKEKTNGEKKWLRNNISTLSSQIIDTAIFITIAFYGQVPNILIMILSQYIVKAIIALLDTPFFYLLTNEKRR